MKFFASMKLEIETNRIGGWLWMSICRG
ncbi:MAG: hypothetical protein K0Q73_8359, partial [Paenibacillus sp.]|nr:hypothetical protein [Paenibacillus sp.]